MHEKFITAGLFGALCLVATGVIPARAADGVVGPGHCNEAGFDSVLASVDGSGGGKITFNCGAATITFTSHKQIFNAVVIDGGGTIVIDGNNNSPLFQISASAKAVLRRITLQHTRKQPGLYPIENFGALTFDLAQVIDNQSAGATVMNHGTLVVNMSTFARNENTNAAEGGGAIRHENGTARIDRSTFDENKAAQSGGAIYSAAPLKIINSTFARGVAGSGGGALFQTESGAASLVHVTMAANRAAYGAGVANEPRDGDSTVTLSSSLLSGNSGGNCSGTLVSGGYNLSDDTSCGSAFGATGDVNNQPLAVTALSNAGGPTLTISPQTGNPAIDHIPHAQCRLAVDQRGGSRPFGSGCDSGAVEVGAPLDSIFSDGFE